MDLLGKASSLACRALLRGSHALRSLADAIDLTGALVAPIGPRYYEWRYAEALALLSRWEPGIPIHCSDSLIRRVYSVIEEVRRLESLKDTFRAEVDQVTDELGGDLAQAQEELAELREKERRREENLAAFRSKVAPHIAPGETAVAFTQRLLVERDFLARLVTDIAKAVGINPCAAPETLVELIRDRFQSARAASPEVN